jgi:hypothetical protein
MKTGRRVTPEGASSDTNYNKRDTQRDAHRDTHRHNRDTRRDDHVDGRDECGVRDTNNAWLCWSDDDEDTPAPIRRSRRHQNISSSQVQVNISK